MYYRCMSTPMFTSLVKPLKAGSYFGAHDASITAALQKERDVWGMEFDPDGALAEKKITRDRTSDLHVTVLTPKESRKVDRDKVAEAFASDVAFEALGIGRVYDGDNEAWFVVLSSPEVQEARARLGLPPKDLHATLGFRTKDIFTTPKTEDTLILDWRTL